jgi:hypothetical protein
MLAVQTNNVLDGLSQIILVAASLEELIVTRVPVKYSFVTVTSACEKRVFTKSISNHKSSVFLVNK